MVAFPLTPASSGYATVTHTSARAGIYGPTDSVTLTLSTSGATNYTVRSFDGTVITSGSVTGTTVTIPAPSAGWLYGWYRVLLTGAGNDALFGAALGSTAFVVMRADSRFVSNPPVGTDGGSSGAYALDLPTRGVANIGPYRWSIQNANAPTTGQQNLAAIQAGRAIERTYWDASGKLDTARPRAPFCSFPNQTWDVLTLRNAANTADTFRVYVATDLLDGATVFVQSSAGTAANTTKVQVYSPNNSTLVETFDNIPATLGRVSLASAFIRVYGTNNVATNLASGPTAIGNAYRSGVTQVVTTLYPDITRYEGPSNEPSVSDEMVHQMRLFYGAVKAGNASAKVLGNSQVAINASSGLATFLSLGGGSWIDEFSFHDYNTGTGGDLGLMRRSYDHMVADLTAYGQQNKPRWMTEFGFFLPVYGVFHPRRARWQIAIDLFRERYGVPRERHSHFYDVSHGFWSFPSWFANGNGSLLPTVALWRVLSEETFGMTYTSAYDFGTTGNNIYAGQRYDGASSGCAVFWAASPLDVSQVVLDVAGVASLTVSDAWGNTSTVPVVNGRATIPTSDLPTYIRIPSSATVTVRSFGTWPALTGTRLGEQLAGPNAVKTTTGSPANLHLISNGRWENGYYLDGGTEYHDTSALPASYTMTFPAQARFDRVVIWSGFCWQSMSTLLDFDVQTLDANGTTWTTQVTRNYAAECSSLLHGADSSDTGTQRETYWPERWIFDLPLPAPVATSGLRIVARQASYGGEPDSACITSGGQGATTQRTTLLEVGVYSDDIAVTQRYASLA